MKDCPLVMDAVGPFIARPNSPVSLAPVWGLSGVRVSAIQAFPSAIRQPPRRAYSAIFSILATSSPIRSRRCPHHRQQRADDIHARPFG
jgi:hypothetical protein